MSSRTSTVPAAATHDTSKVVQENKDTVLTKSMRDMLKVRTFFLIEESIINSRLMKVHNLFCLKNHSWRCTWMSQEVT
ncbi:hypothetical protein LXL04_000541 [Taraxacum kok-saghyz]